jgi:putative ABC transport system permease protein
VGNSEFIIAGSLSGAPGQTGISSSVAPVVYIPIAYLQETGLQQKGSRITYKQFVQVKDPRKIEEVMEELRPRLNKSNIYFDTIESQKKDTARSFSDVTRFLSLVGFIALLMGCIGVASAIHIYVKDQYYCHLKVPWRKIVPCIPDISFTDHCNRFDWFCSRSNFRNYHPAVFARIA